MPLTWQTKARAGSAGGAGSLQTNGSAGGDGSLQTNGSAGEGKLARGEVSLGEAGIGKCYLVMMLEECFALIKKLRSIIKGMFGDKNKTSVLFYIMHRCTPPVFTDIFLTSTRKFLHVVCTPGSLIYIFSNIYYQFPGTLVS